MGSFQLDPARFGAGQNILRVEDRRLLTGTGRFTDDLALAGQAFGAVLRSPYPRARIAAIDASAARASPGVLAVLTAADLRAAGFGPLPFKARLVQRDGRPMVAPEHPALADGEARFVGEPVAFVVAETEAQALDAAEQVAVDYEPLPAVTDLQAAVAPGAPVLVEGGGGNIVAHIGLGDASAVDAAFAASERTVAVELVNNRLVPNALEPRAVIGEYDAASGRYTVHLGNQKPHELRNILAESVLRVPPEKVLVRVGDIGGGFGAKMGVYPEDVLVLCAARLLGRPVRWRASRSESFLADTHGRDQFTRAELALGADGRFLALRLRTLANLGAYATFVGAIVPGEGAKIATTVYRIPAVRVEIDVVATSTAPTGPYRGAGRPEVVFLMERLVERAARSLGVDAVELRRRNLVTAAEMPYVSATGSVYDSGDFPQLLARAQQAADWDGFAARRAEAQARGLLLGRGLSYYMDKTGSNAPTEHAEVVLEADGGVTVLSATQAMGQGLETSYAQLVSARFGIGLERVRVVQGDTDAVRVGAAGSGGSRSLFIGGSAIALAAEAAIEEGRRRAAGLLEADAADIEFAQGRFRIAGTDRGIDVAELAQRGGALRVGHTFTAEGMSWPNGCHVCEVEVDPETGEVRVARFVAVDDVGVVINPPIVHGQVQGGIAQGVGQALFEGCRYDPESGQLLTGSLMDYTLPRAGDLPRLEVEADERAPCRTNPLGAKGAGEGGSIGAPPAVVQAVLDALAGCGVEELAMPVTAEAVWRALRGAPGAA